MTDSMARGNNGAAVRGVVLLVVAIAVGVLLLRAGSSDPAAVVADNAVQPGQTTPVAPATTVPSIVVTEETAPPDDGASTDTTLPAVEETGGTTVETAPAIPDFEPRPAAEVTVQVANSTAIRGVAGTTTDQLKTLNYITATPTNLRGTALERTRVYYEPGNLLEAQALASVLGLDPKSDVFQMFADKSALDQWDEPDVLVVVGTDLAETD